jgi:ABC-2 type transport system permease protein
MKSNILTVVKFEVGRTLKSGVFWLGALLGPVVVMLVFVVSGSAGATLGGDSGATAVGSLKIAYVDGSGLVDAGVASRYGAVKYADAGQAEQDVHAGVLDVFIWYPSNPVGQAVEVVAVNRGFKGYLTYESLAVSIIEESAQEHIGDATLVALAAGSITCDVSMYEGGKPAGGLSQMIPLFAFVIAFYLVFLLQGNRMIIAPLEEKQNRVTEMILTTISARMLLAGKVVSVIIIGLTQMCIVVGLCAVAGVTLGGSFDLPELSFDPVSVSLSAAMLLGGFLFFAALLVAIGAAVPTEKDAQTLFSGVVTVLLVPVLLVAVLVTGSGNPLLYNIITYFPLTAAPVGLMRNALGDLGAWEAISVSVISVVCAVVVIVLAARVFQFGSIEYSKRISLRSALSRR